MSSPSADMMTYLKETFPAWSKIISRQSIRNMLNAGQSIYIKETKSNEHPEVTIDVSYHTVTITVYGGQGETGEESGWDMAYSIWKALEILHNVTIGSTLYECIQAISSLNESTTGTSTEYIWDVSMTRYNGD